MQWSASPTERCVKGARFLPLRSVNYQNRLPTKSSCHRMQGSRCVHLPKNKIVEVKCLCRHCRATWRCLLSQSMGHFYVLSGALKRSPRVFEVFMVFDALRLRNIIQLFGITCKCLSVLCLNAYSLSCPGFHSALVVMAAIQVGQTRTALVWRNAELCAQEWIPAVGFFRSALQLGSLTSEPGV
mgnify:CR=1 FL=1